MYKYITLLILELVLASLLFFNVFVSKSLDTTICLISLSVFLILTVLLKQFKKPVLRNKTDGILVVLGTTIILMGAFYMLGFKTGFSTSYSSIFKNYISPMSWIKVFLIVGLSEITRYVVVNIECRNKYLNFVYQALMVIILFFVEMNIATKSYNFSSFNQLYEFFALIFVQSISKNLLLNYVTKRYGIKPCLCYRLIMDLYIYILPITPKINVFIEGVILLVFPYVVYSILKSFEDHTKLEPIRKTKKHNKISTIIFSIVFAILVALVSREFEYAMIAIGSGSMTGTVNKGDAVVYKRYHKDTDTLKEGDIIVYLKENMTIVHRIYRVYTLDGETVYQTKGDYNENADNWVVKKGDITGIVKFRVLLIAWPSVYINEIF